jgi:hypothetical protein
VIIILLEIVGDKMPIYQKHCPFFFECGQIIVSTRSNTNFCSAKCRGKARSYPSEALKLLLQNSIKSLIVQQTIPPAVKKWLDQHDKEILQQTGVIPDSTGDFKEKLTDLEAAKELAAQTNQPVWEIQMAMEAAKKRAKDQQLQDQIRRIESEETDKKKDQELNLTPEQNFDKEMEVAKQEQTKEVVTDLSDIM